MTTANVMKIDGLLVLPLSEAISEQLAMEEGSSVQTVVTDGGVVLASSQRRVPIYDLDEVLAEHAQWPKEMKEYREWVDAPRVGRELI